MTKSPRRKALEELLLDYGPALLHIQAMLEAGPDGIEIYQRQNGEPPQVVLDRILSNLDIRLRALVEGVPLRYDVDSGTWQRVEPPSDSGEM